MNTHVLKTWPTAFSEIWEGRKRFELRRNDRGFKIGDELVLNEWSNKLRGYTGRRVIAVVTYVLADDAEFPGIRPGYVCMSIDVQKTLLPVDTDRYGTGATLT